MKRQLTFRIAPVLLLVLTNTGCPKSESANAAPGRGSGGGGGSGGPAGNAMRDCEKTAPLYCQQMFRCFPEWAQSTYHTPERCAEVDATNCHVIAGLPGASAKSVEAWGACNRALAAQGCDDARFGGEVSACFYPPGTHQLSEPCTSGAQCVTAHCFFPLDTNNRPSACGTCEVAPREGEDCRPGQEECDVGLQCAGKCVRLQAEGGACADATNPVVCQGTLRCLERHCSRPRTTGGRCNERLDCADDLRCIGGTCGAALPRGAACDLGDDSCDVGLACVTGACAPPLPPNARCMLGSECEAKFCDGPINRLSGLVEDGICGSVSPSAHLGDPCTPADSSGGTAMVIRCEDDDTYCDPATSQCALTKLVGQRCADDGECLLGLTCNTGKCGYAPADLCK
jgi:hypothetical protein